MADLFREIDEDIRRDRLMRLWQRYGHWLLIFCGVVIIAAGVFVGWQNWRTSVHNASAAKFASAVATAQAGADSAAIGDLEVLAAADHSGYGLLARIEAAALKVRNNDRPGGLSALTAIADDTTINESYRDLAVVLWGLYSVDTDSRDALVARLQPLTAADNPWRFIAGEVLALADLRAGDRSAAIKQYQTLADALDAPQTQRARAAEIITDLQD